MAGSFVGSYKLLEEIGEGGFGIVYLAEQEVPVRRRVALKLIKLGMDTRQIIARFEAERQAMAMMEHPNIARVLEAGSTDFGRPYFVMELVRGVPITSFCDSNQLDLKARLQLFMTVCQAVQHAHQKGIIHRDLKPSNILVTMDAGRPVPKVIDFGVAKALDQRLTEKTLFTGFGQMVGTPAYMSPEQAEMSQREADTRSDIYSLGVLLYELLAGEPPFTDKRLRGAGWAEMLRIIAQEEPAKPSTRISTLSVRQRTGIAIARRQDPERIGRLLKSDLDWIVMKCLEKDPVRRYETANGLAVDVRRHLNGDPIEAAPPTTAYRLRKFVHKNWKSASLAAAIVVVLATTSVVSIVQAVRAEKAEKVADRNAEESAALNLFLTEDLFGAADIDKAEAFSSPKRDVRLLDIVDRSSKEVDKRFKQQPLVAAKIHETVGNIYGGLGEVTKAEQHLRRALELCEDQLQPSDPRIASVLHGLSILLGLSGHRYSESEQLIRRAILIREEALGSSSELTLASRIHLAYLAMRQGDYAQAMAVNADAGRMVDEAFGEKHRLSLLVDAERADFLWDSGEREQALALSQQVLEDRLDSLGGAHPDILQSLKRVEWYGYEVHRDPWRSHRMLEEALALSRQIYGDERLTIWFKTRSAVLMERRGLGKAGGDLKRELFENARVRGGDEDLQSIIQKFYVGFHELGYLGDSNEGARIFEEILSDLFETQRDFFNSHIARDHLSIAYWNQRRYDDALAIAGENVESMRRAFGDQAAKTGLEKRQLADRLARLGLWHEAANVLRTVHSNGNESDALARDLELTQLMTVEAGISEDQLRRLASHWEEGIRYWRLGESASSTTDMVLNADEQSLATLAVTLPDLHDRTLAALLLAYGLVNDGAHQKARSFCVGFVETLEHILASGELGRDWRKAAICHAAASTLVRRLNMQVDLVGIDAVSMEEARARWSPVQDEIDAIFEKARIGDWNGATEDFEGLINAERTSLKQLMNLAPGISTSLAVIFVLGDFMEGYQELCALGDPLNTSLDPQYCRVSLNLDVGQGLTLVANAKSVAGRRTEMLNLFKGMEQVAAEELKLARRSLSEAVDGYSYFCSCAAYANLAIVAFREGAVDEGKAALEEAEAQFEILKANHPDTFGNQWIYQGLCEIAINAARTAGRQE